MAVTPVGDPTTAVTQIQLMTSSGFYCDWPKFDCHYGTHLKMDGKSGHPMAWPDWWRDPRSAQDAGWLRHPAAQAGSAATLDDTELNGETPEPVQVPDPLHVLGPPSSKLHATSVPADVTPTGDDGRGRPPPIPPVSYGLTYPSGGICRDAMSCR